jgi:F-type H+-transporting ATPase subunit gamma
VQKNKAKLEAVGPLLDAARDFLSHGVSNPDALENDFYTLRQVNNTAYVVLSGERGLCGSFNTNVLKEALNHMNNKNEHIIPVGAKSKEFFVRRKKNIVAGRDYVGVLENVSYDVATEIAEQLINLYTSKQVDEIYIVHTEFVNILSQNTKVTKLLPLEAPTQKLEIIYEPDINTYLKKSIPIYLAMFIYGTMIESSVCEQASRMTSMDSATRNAGEIVDNLTLQYNRQRQGAITQEISEIVGGANAI